MSALDHLRRLLEKIDGNVSHTLDRHLALAIPPQRSISPDYIPAAWGDVLVPCCDCCARLYRDLPCPEPHFTPCPNGCRPDGSAA